MASASSLAFEEQFLCSICLHEFIEPVSTPCGHNYCKACITGYWDTSDLTQCPLCKKKFRKRPQLQVNTEFRDMVGRFNNMRLGGEDSTLAKPGEVPCDICPQPKFKAVKTCLLCLSSYCQVHLERHQGVKGRKKHQLIDPVSNLEDRVCKKHDKVFELFCKEDQMCVCLMCLKDGHEAHNAVPLELEILERKAQLDGVATEIKTMEQVKCRSISELKYTQEQRRTQSEKEIEEIDGVFAGLILSLQRSQVELTELIKRKQEAAEKSITDHLTLLEQEAAGLRSRRLEMEELLRAEDDLKLLQSSPSLDFPARDGDQFNGLFSFNPEIFDSSQQTYIGMVRTAVTQMEKMFCNEMNTLIQEVRLSDGPRISGPCGADEEPVVEGFIREDWTPPQDKLMMIQQYDAVDVTLDTYTAHRRLEVSEDGKQLTLRSGWLFLHAIFGNRFINHMYVLGKDGFSSGRIYFEVQVGGCSSWLLGVVKESIDKEQPNIHSPQNGSWTFCGLNTQIQLFARYVGDFSEGIVYLDKTPEKIGVFVDYEKGDVTFYDVDTRAQIYSYIGCNFTETTPPLKSLLYSVAGRSLSSRSKLFPILGILGEDPGHVLEITPVAY